MIDQLVSMDADDPRVVADEETIHQERALLAILLCLTACDDASGAAS